jgi:hypothetical protein
MLGTCPLCCVTFFLLQILDFTLRWAFPPPLPSLFGPVTSIFFRIPSLYLAGSCYTSRVLSSLSAFWRLHSARPPSRQFRSTNHIVILSPTLFGLRGRTPGYQVVRPFLNSLAIEFPPAVLEPNRFV